MRALRLAVEDSLRTEDVGDRGLGWGEEFAVPLPRGRDAVQVVVFYFYAFRDLLLLLGRRLGEFLLHGEGYVDLRILGAGDKEGACQGQGSFGCGTLRSEFEGIFSRSLIERYSCECEPGPGGCAGGGGGLVSGGGSSTPSPDVDLSTVRLISSTYPIISSLLGVASSCSRK